MQLVEDFIEAKEEPSVILEEREEKPQGLETELRKIRADVTEVRETFSCSSRGDRGAETYR